MRYFRLLAGLALSAAALNAGEITLLKGGAIKGDILSVTDSEVTYAQDGVKKSRALKDVLKVEYRAAGKPGADDRYSLVELTDGSTLLARTLLIKKREAHLTLLSGPEVKLPLASVGGILMKGHVEKFRRDWTERTKRVRGQEILVLDDSGTISNLNDVEFGDGDARTGDSIRIAVDVGGVRVVTKRELSKIHGLIFKHILGEKAAAATCRLSGVRGDLVVVSSLKAAEDGLMVTTPSGATLSFRKDQIAALSFAKTARLP